jgi:outer membrane protein TolC
MNRRLILTAGLLLIVFSSFRARAADSGTNNGRSSVIDFPTVLRLAGANNLDVQITRQRLAEARANHEGTVWQFFPWISPGAGYRRHDNLIQDVAGNIVDVHKESYTIGPALTGQVDLGDAIYKNLASRQLVKAADYAFQSQTQDSLLAAAQGYFDLIKAQSAVGVANDAVRISTNYFQELQHAVDAGIAFKGDVLRVQVQTEKNRLTLRQAQEQQRIAAARLAQTLHLDPAVELVPSQSELLPLELVSADAALDSLVAQALSLRSELQQNRALVQAAQQASRGATYGPLIPTLGAQAFAGGLGGGPDQGSHRFGESEDYTITLGWRLGPGGLFDRSRVHAAESRLKVNELTGQKLLDEITRQVVETRARVQSQADQLAISSRAIEAAEETLRLSRERKELAVGAVLETVQAEQELTRARLDYVNAITEYNKAQHALKRAIGDPVLAPANSQGHNR